MTGSHRTPRREPINIETTLDLGDLLRAAARRGMSPQSNGRVAIGTGFDDGADRCRSETRRGAPAISEQTERRAGRNHRDERAITAPTMPAMTTLK
ncbi:MAG: hypothetical protein ACRD36_08090 [Candidatus Acidiferrum sp.]